MRRNFINCLVDKMKREGRKGPLFLGRDCIMDGETIRKKTKFRVFFWFDKRLVISTTKKHEETLISSCFFLPLPHGFPHFVIMYKDASHGTRLFIAQQFLKNIVYCIGSAFSFASHCMGADPKSVHVLTVPHQRLDRTSRQRLDDRNNGVAKFIQADGREIVSFTVGLPAKVIIAFFRNPEHTAFLAGPLKHIRLRDENRKTTTV